MEKRKIYYEFERVPYEGGILTYGYTDHYIGFTKINAMCSLCQASVGYCKRIMWNRPMTNSHIVGVDNIVKERVVSIPGYNLELFLPSKKGTEYDLYTRIAIFSEHTLPSSFSFLDYALLLEVLFHHKGTRNKYYWMSRNILRCV